MHGTNNGWPLTAPKPPSPAALDNLGLKITYNTHVNRQWGSHYCHTHMPWTWEQLPRWREKKLLEDWNPPLALDQFPLLSLWYQSGSTFRQKRIMEKQFAGPQFVKDLGEQPCVLTVNGTTLNPIGKITFWRPHLLVWGVCLSKRGVLDFWPTVCCMHSVNCFTVRKLIWIHLGTLGGLWHLGVCGNKKPFTC